MRSLEDIRLEIDEIDSRIIELFKRRMDCSKDVAFYKKENGLPILNIKREQEILDTIEVKGGEYGQSARLLYSNIMELSRALQHNIVGSGDTLRTLISSADKNLNDSDGLKIGCLGIKGSNSHEAVSKLFKNCEAVLFKSFADIFEAVESGEICYGVLPVENSSAGSVSDVYDLILKHRFYIIKEYDMKISYCLCGLTQSTKSDIEAVWSHPQALAQCSDYIAKNNFRTVPYSSTAMAAKTVFDEKRLNVASLCSEQAAQEYGLKILDKDFQNSKTNTTRFIVISKQPCITENADKISLCFSLPHVTGSLYSVLCRFNSIGLNLTKIESRPIRGKDFEYLFYLDFTGCVHSENVLNLLCALSEELPEFSFLGNYSETK